MAKMEFSTEQTSLTPHDSYLPRNSEVLICPSKQKYSLEENFMGNWQNMKFAYSTCKTDL